VRHSFRLLAGLQFFQVHGFTFLVLRPLGWDVLDFPFMFEVLQLFN
jgi:hypothetical protein